eukprot:jgi/Chlat1/1308/Chrsp118S01718
MTVVNFYTLADVPDPHGEVAAHKEFVKLSGRYRDAVAYAEWVKTRGPFVETRPLVAPARDPNRHPFPRLKLKYRAQLVSLAGGTAYLPVTDPSKRAHPLSPHEWRDKLRDAITGTNNMAEANNHNHNNNNNNNTNNHFYHHQNQSSNVKPKVVLLDVRNDYEWDVGHFKGAARPSVEYFKDTDVSGSTEGEDAWLRDVDKDNTEVMMYCTGGIRCDIYSTVLRSKGFKHVYTLEGGVANYLKEVGGGKGDDHLWRGHLYVFDERLALAPSDLSASTAAEISTAATESIARCRDCGVTVEPLHRNCANIDCNDHFLMCDDCAELLRGCCGPVCLGASRLRPMGAMGRYFDRWHVYSNSGIRSSNGGEQEQEHNTPGTSAQAIRRQRWRQRLKEKRVAVAQQLETAELRVGTAGNEQQGLVSQAA